MPLPVESLTRESSAEQIREAISRSIEQCMHEGGREQDQCAAIAYSIARKRTGKPIGRKRGARTLAKGP